MAGIGVGGSTVETEEGEDLKKLSACVATQPVREKLQMLEI